MFYSTHFLLTVILALEIFAEKTTIFLNGDRSRTDRTLVEPSHHWAIFLIIKKKKKKK